MSLPASTVVIAARNAAATIERAVASAALSSAAEILLIDDFSTDATVALAQRAGGARVRVVRPARHHSLGLTRDAGLRALRTPFAINLDADDALLPGRVERLVAAMENESADLAADSLELFSGATDTLIRRLWMPAFMSAPGAAVRIFERNYLPGIGQIGFRTERALQTGYDFELHGVEDTDFFLRAIAAGARVAIVPETGYRMYSYPGSVSRDLARQRAMLAQLLRKHSYDQVARLYRSAGYGSRVTAWGLCSMAIFREDPEHALIFLERAYDPAQPDSVLEPRGPCPVPEGWRWGFTKGTLLCLLGRAAEAVESFEFAARFDHGRKPEGGEGELPYRGSPDLLNNSGVALASAGRVAEAREKFSGALELFPAYLDAKTNLHADEPRAITPHPLRMQPSRSEYA